MRLSILMGSTENGLLACSRVMHACSWASPDVEVIVRDVSGDAQKRELLASLECEHCKIILAEPCDEWTNFGEVLRQAKGDFVFRLGEDDISFDQAIAALPAMIEQIEQHDHDSLVIGVTGAYVVETDQASNVMGYTNAESDDLTARVSGYLTVGGANLLHYTPVRRDLAQRVFSFLETMPFNFPFHDRLVSLLYLLNGKFVRIKRFLYLHDPHNWQTTEVAQKCDVDCYRAAGFDPVINLLHWYLCGFEGALLVRNTDEFPDYPIAQRQAIADRWFSVMFTRFKGQARLTFDSGLTGEAQKICAKLQTSTGQLTFDGMLEEICRLIALSSPDSAQLYFDFWKTAIDRGQVMPAAAEPMVERRAS